MPYHCYKIVKGGCDDAKLLLNMKIGEKVNKLLEKTVKEINKNGYGDKLFFHYSINTDNEVFI